ncbi:serine/threonine protein kinase [Cystobacter fuscus]|uniref:serine/threonine protein kinase n=1 Tax=Cystobacter fuscus TaxID=43 RepID=UPI002B2AE817|nr:serine/threonine protein kinase [Cystobacter fuscus]
MSRAEGQARWGVRPRGAFVLRRPRGWRREHVRACEFPRPGANVGGYHLEARLGTGGQGSVYRARREGGVFAVKLIPLALARAWGQRELEVMARLKLPGIAALEGHGHWPAVAPRFLFLVTRYVKGRTVYAWARETNPSAREVVEKGRALVGVLEAVHGAGVVHRDVKGDNVLVREEGGEVVLVDFGAASYANAPRLTVLLPPGTPRYRSPEAMRFLLGHSRGERYESPPGDDLWAFGVLLYWLLTGSWPFEGTEWGAVLHPEPEPPRARNPRVPAALSALCLRLLARTPEERFADAGAVGEALEAARAGAGADWDVPLCDAHGPDTATTHEVAPLETDEALARLERLAAHAEHHPPVRGRPVVSEEALVPGRSPRGWRWGLGGVLVLGLALGGLQSLSGQEMAPPGRPMDAEGGAVSSPEELIPAPVVVPTMLGKEDTRLNKDTKTKKALGLTARVAAAGLVCHALTGCSASQRQVSATPEPARCPAGASEAMANELALSVGDRALILFDSRWVHNVPVREGPARVEIDLRKGRWAGESGIFISGTLSLGRDRVFGRFTEARIRDGEPFPVCLEMTDMFKGGRGVLIREPGGSPDTVLIYSSEYVVAVKQFQ